jgi:hypothetical protein
MLTVWYNSVHIAFKILLLASYSYVGLAFPYTPSRAKYEWKDLLYHAYTIVEFLQMIIL